MASENRNAVYTLGGKIKKLRREKGFSQLDLALETDTDKSMISRLENGLYDVPLSVLAKIADALEIPLWLLLQEGKENNIGMLVSFAAEHRKKINALPEEAVRKSVRLMKVAMDLEE